MNHSDPPKRGLSIYEDNKPGHKHSKVNHWNSVQVLEECLVLESSEGNTDAEVLL
jgi:hypothetical protein